MKKGLLFALVLNVATCFAQQIHFVKHPLLSNLPTQECYNITQDNSGQLWVGTANGFVVYNGDTLHQLNASGRFKNHPCFGGFFTSKDKGFFYSLKNRFFEFDVRKDSVNEMPFNKNLDSAITNKLLQFYTVCLKDATTLFCNTQYSSFEINLKNESVTAIEADTTADYYFTYEKGNFLQIKYSQSLKKRENILKRGDVKVRVKKGNDIIDFSVPFGNKKIPSWRSYTIVNKKGELITNFDNILVKIKTDNTVELTDAGGAILSLYVDKSNTLWTGLLNNGVKYYQDCNLKSKPAKGLVEYSVTGIYEDYEGSFWCTTLEKGVYYCRNKFAYNFPEYKDLQQFTFNIKQYGEELYIGSLKNRLLKISKDTILLYDLKQLDSKILRISKNGNSFLLGTNKGVYETADFKILKELRKCDDKNPVAVSFMVEHSEDSSIVALRTAVYFVTKNCIQHFYTPKLPILHAARGWGKTFIIGDPEKLIEVDFKGNEKVLTKITTDIIKIKPVQNDGLYLYTDDSLLLIKENGSINNLTRLWGINGFVVLDVLKDKHKSYWCGTNKGLLHIIPGKKGFQKILYTKNDGLIVNRTRAAFELNDLLYFNSEEGLITFPANYNPIISEPKFELMHFTAGHKTLDVSQKEFELKYTENNLVFQFALRSYLIDKPTKLQYNVKEVDNSWHSLEGNRVRFDNIASGEYTFNFRVLNYRSVPGKVIYTIKVTITPPFWRTIWFAVLLIILVIILCVLIIKYRVDVIRKREEEKTVINKKIAEYQMSALRAQMNPHFIFNALNSIQHYILHKDTEYAYDYLAKFGRLIRQVLINSEHSVLTLDKEIEILKLYVELEQRRFKNKFDFEFTCAEELDTHDIVVPTMLVQPFIENAIWHGIMNLPEGEKGKLKLSFVKAGMQLKITVEDNGIGREAAALKKTSNEYKSVGMMFTNKRLELLESITKQQASILVSDLTDADGKAIGTIVEILIGL